MADAVGAAQSAQDRWPGAGARNSAAGRIRNLETRCTPASMLIFVRCSPPSSWPSTGEAVTYRRAGGAQQSAGASVSQARPEAARPLCDLHGEQQPLPRGLRRRRALRAVLHLRQFVPDAKRTRLHRQQQRVAHPHHVGGKARRRARGAEGMPQGRTLHRRRRRGRKRSHRRPARGDGRSAEDADRGRMQSAPRCSIRRAPPAGRRAFCGRCRSSRRRSSCRCSISCRSSGSTARA